MRREITTWQPLVKNVHDELTHDNAGKIRVANYMVCFLRTIKKSDFLYHAESNLFVRRKSSFFCVFCHCLPFEPFLCTYRVSLWTKKVKYFG